MLEILIIILSNTFIVENFLNLSFKGNRRSTSITTIAIVHCETKPFRWHIWMQNPAQNKVSDMNFQICLELVLIHSKWSKLVPEHPLGPKKHFLITKHPQCNFNKFFRNSKFAAQNEFLAFSSKQAQKTRFGGQVKI